MQFCLAFTQFDFFFYWIHKVCIQFIIFFEYAACVNSGKSPKNVPYSGMLMSQLLTPIQTCNLIGHEVQMSTSNDNDHIEQRTA